MALSDYWEVYTAAIVGVEQAIEMPAETLGVLFQPSGGDVTITHAPGGATITIKDSDFYEIVNRNIANHSFYFNGTATLNYAVEKCRAS